MSQRFVSQRTLAEDGASRLEEARDSQSGKPVIIRRFIKPIAEEKQTLQTLFGALKVINHPHLEAVQDVVEDGDDLVIVTRAPAGENVSAIVTRGPFDLQEFKAVTKQLLEALAAAHDQGVVHGAIHPERILIAGPQGGPWHARISGFGVGFGSAEKTQAAEAYLCVPPEQWEQKPARRRSDVYSLGCVLYEAVSGRRPFEGRTLKEVRGRHLKHDVLHLDSLAPHVPAWMRAWVMSLLRTNPDDRPKNARVALEEYLQAESTGSFDVPEPQGGRSATTGYIQPLGVTTVPGTGGVPVPQPQPVAPRPNLAPARQTTANHTVGAPGQVPPPTRSPARQVPGRTPGERFQPGRMQPALRWTLMSVGAVVVLVLGFLFLRGGGDEAPVTVQQEEASPSPNATADKSAPVKAKAPSGKSPGVTANYPKGRAKPPAYADLAMHFTADAGVLGVRRNDKNQRLAADIGAPVLAWKDLAERARDNSLTLKADFDPKLAPVLEERAPDAAFPLAAKRKFLRFSGEGTPAAVLTTSAKNEGADLPFGGAMPAGKRGITVAVVLYQEVRGQQQTVLHLSGGGGSMSLRMTEKGAARCQMRLSGAPEGGQPPVLTISESQFSVIEPLLLVATWSAQPAQATLHVLGAGGWSHTAGPVDTKGCPTGNFTSLSLGRDPPPSATAKNQSLDPVNLKALRGGIAEVLVYSTVLADPDMLEMQRQLAARYFPVKK